MQPLNRWNLTAVMLCLVESTGLRFIAFKRSVSGILRHLFRRSGRKNVMSMRELFFPDPLAGFEKMAGFQIFYCLKIKCFHS